MSHWSLPLRRDQRKNEVKSQGKSAEHTVERVVRSPLRLICSTWNRKELKVKRNQHEKPSVSMLMKPYKSIVDVWWCVMQYGFCTEEFWCLCDAGVTPVSDIVVQEEVSDLLSAWALEKREGHNHWHRRPIHSGTPKYTGSLNITVAERAPIVPQWGASTVGPSEQFLSNILLIGSTWRMDLKQSLSAFLILPQQDRKYRTGNNNK